MKAIVHTAYGPPEELQLQEVTQPVPGDGDILIKVHATTVTTSDCNVRNQTFVPGLFRLPTRAQFGLTKPKIAILGMDLAGEVAAVGAGVTRFKPGDRVFGSAEPELGAHAEFVCLPQDRALAPLPHAIAYEDAAALPLAGNTALYFIRDQGRVQAGQSVLINGASGAIGAYAVQLAKYFGAAVTGVCSGANVDMVRSLGADRVIDYTKEDVAQGGETYDVIFDVVGKLPFSRCRGALKRNGLYLASLPTASTLVYMLSTSLFGDKKVKNGSGPTTVENLVFLQELMAAGKLRTVIGRRFPLAQTADAFRYVETGHKVGNAVIIVAPDEEQPAP